MLKRNGQKAEGHVCTNATGLSSRVAADVHSGDLRGARTCVTFSSCSRRLAGLITVACGGSATTSVTAPSPTPRRAASRAWMLRRALFGPRAAPARSPVTRRAGVSVVAYRPEPPWVVVTSGAPGQGDGHRRLQDRSQSRSGGSRSGALVIAETRARGGAASASRAVSRSTGPNTALTRNGGTCATPDPHACAVRMDGRVRRAVGHARLPASGRGTAEHQPDGRRECRGERARGRPSS